MKTTNNILSTLITITTLSATIGVASAAVTTFSINQTFSQGDGQVDITSPLISLGGAGSFEIDPGTSSNFFDFTFSGTGSFSTYGTDRFGYHYLESFAVGDVINSMSVGLDDSTASDWDSILVSDVTDGVWDTSHSGHLGFVADGGEYGYICYDYTREDRVSTITLKDGAYESVVIMQPEGNQGAGIKISDTCVPEPSSTLLIGLGGLTLIMRRKRIA